VPRNLPLLIQFTVVRHTEKRATNRTNSTFGFLLTQKPTQKNQKSCFLANAREEMTEEKVLLKMNKGN